MSFVIAQPEFVTAAAENLASIRSALTEAAAAASGPTSAMAAAGADEVSAAIAQMFGAYGQEFQAFNAQAAAFHAEFVSLLNGSGAAYLATELANAQRNLINAANAGQSAAAAAVAAEPLLTIPIPIPPLPPSTGGGLGGLLGGSGGLLGPVLFGGSGGLLGGLVGGGSPLASLIGSNPLAQAFGQFGGAFASALLAGQAETFLTNTLTSIPGLGGLLQGLLPGIFGTPPTGITGPPLNAWQMLYIHTNQNLVGLNEAWARDPNPLAGAITHNWQGYAYETGRDWQLAFNNLPFELQHMPETLQIGAAGLASFDAAKYLRISADGATGAQQTLNTSFSKFNADLNANFAKFPSDWAKVNYDIGTGHYNTAVTDGTRAVLNLFLNGFDTSNLNDIKLEGPIADLFPVLALPGTQLEGMSTLMTGGSVGQHMVANAGRFFTALSDTSVSAGVAVEILPPDLTANPPVLLPSIALQMNAFFGLPLSLMFGLGGAPVAMLNGIATSGQIIGAGMVTGNPSQTFGGIIDMPAYALDGLLNGEAIVDVPLPVTISTGNVVLGDIVTIPIVAHLPFDGLLVPPHPLKATIPVQLLGINIPVDLTLGGTKFGGLFSLLTNNGFRILADAITN
jgi:hypothetical protein